MAQEVTDPIGIIPEALDILAGIRNYGFIFPGSKHLDCFAIAQPQVSSRPLRYFVINGRKERDEFKNVAAAFEGLIIVNPHLVHKDKTTKVMWKDGCMSWPYRPLKKVKRYEKIQVNYDIILDADSTFKAPSVKQIRGKQLSGLAAMVFLHELEHLNGKSIY